MPTRQSRSSSSTTSTESEDSANPPSLTPTSIQEAIRRLEEQTAKPHGHIKHLWLKSRSFAPTIDPFLNVDEAFAHAIPAVQDQAKKMDDSPQARYHKFVEQFDRICEVTPLFRTITLGLIYGGHGWSHFISGMSTRLSNSRSEDLDRVSDMLPALRDYFPDSYVSEAVRDKHQTFYQALTSEGWRCFWNTERLIPHGDRDHFKQDPGAYISAVLEYKYRITEEQWPVFLYGSHHGYLGGSAEWKGLLMSPLLVKIWVAVFLGPTFVPNPFKGSLSKRCKAVSFQLNRVTPESIAYAAVLGRLALAGDGWRLLDTISHVNAKTEDNQTSTGFDYARFHNNIVRYLNSDLPAAMQALEWWQTQVPVLAIKARRGIAPPPAQYDDPIERMKAEWQSRQPGGSGSTAAPAAPVRTFQVSSESSDEHGTSPHRRGKRRDRVIAFQNEINAFRHEQGGTEEEEEEEDARNTDRRANHGTQQAFGSAVTSPAGTLFSGRQSEDQDQSTERSPVLPPSRTPEQENHSKIGSSASRHHREQQAITDSPKRSSPDVTHCGAPAQPAPQTPGPFQTAPDHGSSTNQQSPGRRETEDITRSPKRRKIDANTTARTSEPLLPIQAHQSSDILPRSKPMPRPASDATRKKIQEQNENNGYNVHR